MKDNKTEYQRLARYLSGESLGKEAAEIEARIKNDPMYAAFTHRFKNIWDARTTSPNTYDAEAGWKRLCREIDDIERGKRPISTKHPSEASRAFRPLRTDRSWLIRVAAILLVVVLTGLFAFMYLDDGTGDEPLAMQEVVTEKGQRSNIHLKDGSRITLNSDSRVFYPREFSEELRKVHVEGEAFFRIAPEERPFYVYADEVVIQILGTEFNVRTCRNGDVEVVVASGSVDVRYADLSADEQTLHLEEGDRAMMPGDRIAGPMVMRATDLEPHIGWLEYRYVFEDTPLSEIAKVLERSYGVDIAFADPELKSLRLSANFEGESIYEVLRVIELVLELEYEMDDHRILLSRM